MAMLSADDSALQLDSKSFGLLVGVEFTVVK